MTKTESDEKPVWGKLMSDITSGGLDKPLKQHTQDSSNPNSQERMVESLPLTPDKPRTPTADDEETPPTDKDSVCPPPSSTGVEEGSLSLKTLPIEKKLTFAVMAFATMIACACFSLFAPFFPKEAAKKGASQSVIGLIFGCFELCVLLSAPFFGSCLSHTGPHFMALAGLFLCGGTTILFGVMNKSPPGVPFIALCLALRAVESIGAAAFFAASFALVANEFPDQVNTVLGMLESFTGLGLMFGPPIGGSLYEVGGFGLPFWVVGGILIVCACVSARVLPEQMDDKIPQKGSMTVLLTNPVVLATTLSIASGAYSMGFLEPTLARHVEQFNLRPFGVGLLFVGPAAVYAISAPLWGYLSDKKDVPNTLMIMGNLGTMVSFLLIGPSPLLPSFDFELWMVIVSLLAFGLFNGCIQVSAIQGIIKAAEKKGFEKSVNTYGKVAGLFHAAFSLGTLLGAIFGSIIVDNLGFPWSATITACIFLFSNCVFTLTLSYYKLFD